MKRFIDRLEADAPADGGQPAGAAPAAEPPRERHRAPIQAPDLNRGRTLGAAAENISALFADEGVTPAPDDTAPARLADGRFQKRDAEPVQGDGDALDAAAEQALEAPTAEPDAATEEAEAPPDDGTKAVETIAELAELLDVDPSVIYSLDAGLGAGPNGELEKATIGELKDGKAMTRVVAAERAKVAEAQEALSRERAELHQAVKGRLDEADGVTRLAHERLMARWNGEEMAGLRHSDPAEWTAKQAEMQAEAAEIQRAAQTVQAQRQAAEETERARQATEYQQLLAEQGAALIEAIPEWRDPKTATAQKTALATYLRDQGFPDDEVGTLSYARHIVIARKAMLYDQQQSEGKEAVTRVLTLSKVQKPGRRQGSAQVADATYSRARQALKKTGSMADAAAAISLLR